MNMRNDYLLRPAKITRKSVENENTRTLHLSFFEGQNKFEFLAGQFMQVGLPGFGECPISISSDPLTAKKGFALTVRGVGALTNRLISLPGGGTIWLRGPFGNGFPEVKGNLILIGGGCGFIPLHSVYEENKSRQDIKIQLFLGCRDEASLVFKSDYSVIAEQNDLQIILEKEKLRRYGDKVGFVTDLLKERELLPDAQVFVCGPQPMYRPVVRSLLSKNVKPENIYLSLEKRMHCGLGVCQHCAIGTKYVCKDGPVFPYSFLMNLPEYQ